MFGTNKLCNFDFIASNLDHGLLLGLADDDHTQYLLADGTRALAGNWSLGGFNLTNGGTITANTLIVDSPTLVVNAAGYTDKVGIGTATPGDKLHIVDTRTANESAALYVQQIGVNANGTAYGAVIEKTGASRTNVGGSFSATGAENNYGLIVSAGDVGIGTSSPDSAFHIKASVPGTVGDDYAGQLIIQSPTNDVNTSVVITGYKSDVSGNPDVQLWYLGSSSAGNEDIIFLNRRNAKLALGTNDSTRITILGNGDVGINVTDPDAKLEVVGTLHVSDAVTFDGTLGAGAITGTSFTDGTATITGGVIATTGDIRIQSNTSRLEFGIGFGGSAFLQFDGSTLLIKGNEADPREDTITFEAGHFNFSVASETDRDIQVDWIGTTNSGQFFWREDEDYFEFMDTIVAPKLGINGTPAAPLDIYQFADSSGLKIRGFDDRSGESGIFIVNSSGNFTLLGSKTVVFTATEDIFFRAGTDKDINFGDNTNADIFLALGGGTTRIGVAANFSEFEPDGTYVMNGAATVFNDLVLPLSSARVPAANAPTWSGFIGNLNAYTYGLNDFQEFSTELAHSYKGGATIEFHVHGAVNGSDVDERTIKIEIEYTIADTPAESGFGDVYPATTTINAELTIPASTTDLTVFSVDIGDDTSASFVQGAIIKGRIRRIASTGTEPTADPFLTEVGIHIESDTIGTRTSTSK